MLTYVVYSFGGRSSASTLPSMVGDIVAGGEAILSTVVRNRPLNRLCHSALGTIVLAMLAPAKLSHPSRLSAALSLGRRTWITKPSGIHKLCMRPRTHLNTLEHPIRPHVRTISILIYTIDRDFHEVDQVYILSHQLSRLLRGLFEDASLTDTVTENKIRT